MSSRATAAVTFGRIEARFDLPQVVGNPFDFTVNDVRVTLTGPDGKAVTLPAFFDGGTTWRVRHAPTAAGKWTVRSVTLNGADATPKAIEPREFAVVADAAAGPGYVRIDPKDKMRFAFDDGTRYYPIGYDLAWRHMGEPKMPPLVESLGRMKAAGVNWTRIWMNAWDGKNLDWVEPTTASPKPGTLDLGVAKHWDDLVAAADANGVRFQLTLQHHGQYSAKTDSNWAINPWNTANGGFLDDPVKFFSDEQARKLTRAKYRYIVARWGYSPSIMAWELFNEVEFTDAFTSDLDNVGKWHAEMAAFLREQDPYRHLITTSSRVSEPKLWPAMDYYQSHVYAPDLVTAVQTLEAQQLDKPYFYGEIGSNAYGQQVEVSDTIRVALWASLMSNASGAAQYWYWYEAEPRGLLYHYTSAQAFLKASRLAERDGLKPIEAVATTPTVGPLSFGPGSGWAAAKNTSFTVRRSGTVENLGGMSSYLQGNGENKKMFPFAEFNVDYAQDGTFAIRADEMNDAGATLNVSIDGKPAAILTLPAPPRPGTTRANARPPRIDATLAIPVPAGKHVVRLENTGGDWIKLREITLAPYAPTLGVVAKGTKDFAALWAYRRQPGDGPIDAKIAIPGLDPGEYTVVWWDTAKGVATKTERLTATAAGLTVPTGPIDVDLAIYVARDASTTASVTMK